MSILHTPTEPFIESPENDTYIGFIDASHCNTMENFYTEISAALQFPNYFGRNLDALDEMLCDLSWIDFSIVFLIINNQEKLLSDDPEKLGELIAFLVDVGNDNFETILK
jgi:RNAse (barnase) inhibitor barstar